MNLAIENQVPKRLAKVLADVAVDFLGCVKCRL
jgi:hypothetical protein